MITDLLFYLFRFIVLLTVQVVVLNNIQFSGFINPFVYIMFIQTLPVKMPRPLQLVVAFAAGLVVDMFQNTMGMHAAACVFLAYTRPGVLRLMAPRDGYDSDAIPSVRTQGFTWFLIYASVTTLIHHLALFYIEVFRFSEFFSTLARVLLSTVASIAVILIAQYLVNKPIREKA